MSSATGIVDDIDHVQYYKYYIKNMGRNAENQNLG